MNIYELKQQRQAAGEAFAAAAQAYVAAGIELAAHDAAVENLCGNGVTIGGGFGHHPIATGHSEFLTGEELKKLNTDHHGQVMRRVEKLIRSVK